MNLNAKYEPSDRMADLALAVVLRLTTRLKDERGEGNVSVEKTDMEVGWDDRRVEWNRREQWRFQYYLNRGKVNCKLYLTLHEDSIILSRVPVGAPYYADIEIAEFPINVRASDVVKAVEAELDTGSAQ